MPERQSTPGGANTRIDESTVRLARETPEPGADGAPDATVVVPAAGHDAEATQVLPSAGAPPSAVPISQVEAAADPMTVQLGSGAPPPPPVGPIDGSGDGSGDGPAGGQGGRGRGRKLAMVGGGVLVALGALYGADLALSQGAVPRGVTVAGVPVGGLSFAAAQERLQNQVEPRTREPIQVQMGEATTKLDPVAAGLTADWPATLARAGAQPLNPITRLTSFFGGAREVGVATVTDQSKLDGVLAELAPTVDKPAVEGSVSFDGDKPVAVEPVPGHKLDVPAAAQVLEHDWVDGKPVPLPLTSIPAVTTQDDVQKAIKDIAEPAVSAPVTITGDAGTSSTLSPAKIAGLLTFRPDPGGGLAADVAPAALEKAVGTALAPSEKKARDASLDFASGAPVVVPSVDGHGVDYPATATALGPVLAGPAPRKLAATYADQPAKVSTEKIQALGAAGLISEFSTGGFAVDSGKNIKRAADQINGTILAPGDTFSLNDKTNPRDAAHGYVEAGIIEDGHPARGIGGGVSQVATTLYNAAYFAGMTLVAHKEHSFYISRYPPGREATVFDNLIDLKFRNDGPAPVMIQTAWSPSGLTVRFLGTKQYEVTSATGPRTDPTEPKTVNVPAGQPCVPSKGAPGFTVTDTRTLRNLKTGEVHTDPTHTVRYNPVPIVVCEQPG